MNTEQKAKAYDKTIEKLREFYRDCDTVSCLIDVKEELANLFPELKESDEERIRKQIISFLKEFERVHFRNLDFSSWIAWLEKQCEPTDINPSEFDLRLNKLLKQFETLPKEELVNCLSFYLNVVQNDGTYREEKQGEQKPTEWNEEDENNLYLTTVAIGREYSGELFLDPKKVNEQVGIGRKLINWLRSFENRVGCEVNCTTTKEWSEEDEKRIKNILSVLNVQVCWDGATGKKGNPYQKEINWLKSLKDRYTWKPSEEQLEALKNAIHIKPFENPSDSLLWGLYEQIKKLKGE